MAFGGLMMIAALAGLVGLQRRTVWHRGTALDGDQCSNHATAAIVAGSGLMLSAIGLGDACCFLCHSRMPGAGYSSHHSTVVTGDSINQSINYTFF
jgi:hypothetical protein